MAESERLNLIAEVAANYLRRNAVGIDQIQTVIMSVTRAMSQASKEIDTGIVPAADATAATSHEALTPAVPIKKSVQKDYVVCLEDGVKARTLKRHLLTAHGMTPKDYREKWGLPRDYPMVAPAYSEQRSRLAKELGLGRKPGTGTKRANAAPAKRRARRA
jgi:predicted transcriptional regulator